MEDEFKKPVAVHWTRKGVLSIRRRWLGGSVMYDLFLDGRLIATGSFANTVAEALNNGAYDKELGFPAAQLRAPSDYKRWTNLTIDGTGQN